MSLPNTVFLAYQDYLIEDQNKAPTTARQYKSVARQISESRKTPRKWLADKITDDTPTGTANVWAAGANAWYDYLVEHGRKPPDGSPVAPDRRSSQSSYRTALTPDQLEAFYDAAKLEPDPYKTMFQLFPRTGLRLSEMVSLRRDAIQGKADDYYLEIVGKGKGGRQTKGGGKSRRVPLSVPARVLLTDYLADHPSTSEWVFPSSQGAHGHYSRRTLQERIVGLREKIKGEWTDRLTCHVLRHTFATRFLAEHGYDSLPALQDILGHARLETTRIYAAPSWKHLVELMKGLE